MRYSEQNRTEPAHFQSSLSNEQFFVEVSRRCDADDTAGALLLVGASDERALYVRRAQAALRLDRRASYFSHVALIARFDASAPDRSVGLEVALDPQDSALQVPERNGVTRFELSRYLDADRYPNLAFVTLRLRDQIELGDDGAPSTRSAAQCKRALLEAACAPHQSRERYPLWEQLGTWSKYTFDVHRTPNPLLDNVPLPAAAFCESAYAAIGIDLSPAAAANNTCPEVIWATFLRWQHSLGQVVTSCAVHAVVREPHGISRDALSVPLVV